MKITNNLTDAAILAETGTRLTQRRLEFHLTQADLAREAGVSKRTLEHAEAGSNVQMSTIIRIFRVLDLLPTLDKILPESKPGPIEIMAKKGRIRRRASSSDRKSAKEKTWTWGDDQ